MPVYENERGTFLFNSKDLCMIEHIPEMLDAGIDSFKIEGRMKNALYVATVARTYRKAIDDYQNDPKLYFSNLEWYREEIGKCTTREFTTGFYFGKTGEDAQIYKNSTYIKNYIYLGTVENVGEDGLVQIEQKNKFSVGETIEIMKPDGRNLLARVEGIFTEDGTSQKSAPHPKQKLRLSLSEPAQKYDILRIRDRGKHTGRVKKHVRRGCLPAVGLRDTERRRNCGGCFWINRRLLSDLLWDYCGLFRHGERPFPGSGWSLRPAHSSWRWPRSFFRALRSGSR